MSKETPKSAPTPKDAPKGLIDSKLFLGFAKAKEAFTSKEGAKKGLLKRLWLAFTAFLGEQQYQTYRYGNACAGLLIFYCIYF
ncbi:MAG: hypothetical protein V1679_00990 [Candidatus Peregrinibacteria bacterium]